MVGTDTASIELDRSAPAFRRQQTLQLVLQADRLEAPAVRCLLGGVHQVLLGRSSEPAMAAPLATVRIKGRVLHWGLSDRGVSSNHARLVGVDGAWTIEDLQSKNGTFIRGRKVQQARLRDGDLIELGNSFFLFREDVPAPPDAPQVFSSSELDAATPGLATMVPELQARFAQLRTISPSAIFVVLGGETGTGKEVTASAVHALSGRPGPFQAVNCGAIAPTLIESELFGFRKGAFSGATEDRQGLVRASDRGTLLLDEFADLPLPAQAALLRVLQEAEVLPIGGTRAIKVDLRLIVATHRDLDELVAGERLRADLFARVSGFTLVLPPLRERREDLGLLISGLLQKHAGKHAAISLSLDAARALLLHRWPLNIRELEKTLMTAVALAPAGRIELPHLPAALQGAPQMPEPGPAAASAQGAAKALSNRDQMLRDRLVDLLREHRGNVTAVAAAMGKFRTQVHRWVKRLGIDPTQYRE